MQTFRKTAAACCLLAVLSGCAEVRDRGNPPTAPSSSRTEDEFTPDLTGIVLEKSSASLTIVCEWSPEQVTGKSIEEIKRLGAPIYYISLRSLSTPAEVGDIVKVQTNGMFEDSYPAHTAAVRIEVEE